MFEPPLGVCDWLERSILKYCTTTVTQVSTSTHSLYKDQSSQVSASNAARVQEYLGIYSLATADASSPRSSNIDEQRPLNPVSECCLLVDNLLILDVDIIVHLNASHQSLGVATRVSALTSPSMSCRDASSML